ncbi:Ribonuclease III domain-containing protein isoform 3 [Cladophialophora immunda]|nr:Ribonuclease III domain-containing protein isoform 2 [Cladophialophora immunda]OQV03063.1 Ribonuclease III domain-containing protein isoform 3 [Cladophialophora immunda]
MTTNEAKVAACESIINYEFQDPILCLQALQASGHAIWWHHGFVRVYKNDRLAVFGDAVAKAAVCRRWFDSGRNKGQWTQVEQALLGNSNLSAVGRRHGLQDCVILNQGTVSVSDKTMATTVEAILGAVLIDGGNEALGAVLITLGLTHPLLQAEQE